MTPEVAALLWLASWWAELWVRIYHLIPRRVGVFA